MFIKIIILIVAVGVGYICGLAQNRHESYKAYLKGLDDGYKRVWKNIECYKLGFNRAFERDLELIKSFSSESEG